MKGFTLIEGLVALSLLLIISAIIIPASVDIYRQQTAKEVGLKVVTVLEKARSQSISNKGDSAYGVKFLPDSYILFKDEYSEGDNSNIKFDLPGNADIKGTDEVKFSELSGITSSTTLVINYRNRTDKVLINSEGMINIKKKEQVPPDVYWSFNQGSGTTVYDSISDNHGTIYDATWTDGVSGSALEFDGTDDYVNVGKLGDFGSGTEKATYSFWLKYSEGDEMIPFGVGSLWQWPFELKLNPWGAAGKMRVYIRDTNGNALSASTDDVNANDGNWHHWVITVDSANNVIDIYKDGTDLNVDASGNSPDNFVNFEEDFLIGAFNNRGTPWNHFEGSIDELRIYDRVLTQEEIRNL